MALSHSLARAADSLRPLVLLLLRVVVGAAFVHAGIDKFSDLAKVTKGFEELKIPMASVLGPFVATVETAGGAALILGLWGRFAALMLSGVMVVALATAHKTQLADALKTWVTPVTIVAFAFLLDLLVIIAFGPGRFSVDHVRSSRRSSPPPPPPAR